MRVPLSIFLWLILFMMLSLLSLILSHYSLTAMSNLQDAQNGRDTRLSKFSQRPAKVSKCRVHLTPECLISPLVKYWSEDADCYESPLRALNGLSTAPDNRKYVIMEPDLGGWNNIRMSLEVAIVFALATGRILVLPPHQVLYLLNQNKKWKDNKTGVEDYVDFRRISLGNAVEVIPMGRFLQEVAAEGQLSKPFHLEDGESFDTMRGKKLWNYLAAACYSRPWQPGRTYLTLNTTVIDIKSIDPVRRKAMAVAGQNRRICWNDADMASQKAIFFSGSPKNRLLTLFYAYLFFPSENDEKLMKRFVRDRVRYHDEIYCIGGRIVEQLALRADPSLSLPISTLQRTKYVAFHIRRGDFQHGWVKLPAEEILKLTGALVPDRANRVVYIATDERNSSWFDPFRKAFKAVYFLNDFVTRDDELKEIERNKQGMLEQIVCASSDIFIGTPLSTFTGYITRIRGYMNVTVPGIYERTFYYMEKHRMQLHESPHIHVPFWPREFTEAFAGIEEV